MKAPVCVRTHITLDRGRIPLGLEQRIRSALTIPNGDKELALREHVRGAHKLPDTVSLYRVQGRDLILPRGFLRDLRDILPKIEIDDARVEQPIELLCEMPELFEYQQYGGSALICEQTNHGLYMAPTGSGKTVTGLAVIAHLQQRSLIIVHKQELLDQWAERAREFLGYEVGVYGAGQDDIKDITIAMQQTLATRHAELQDVGWFDQWGLVMLDEAHHASALTFQKVMQSFAAKYRFGLTATPKEDNWQFPMSYATIGPVVWETTNQELEAAGRIVRPIVRVVPTEFEFDYVPTVRIKGRIRRNNYAELQKKLAENHDRNWLVADTVIKHVGHCCLVVSRRLGHLETLAQMIASNGWDQDRIWMLTGKQSREERKIIMDDAENANCVILSTIADEALDIPRLDRVFLPWPTKANHLITQQIGRIRRNHPAKRDVYVYDFMDKRISLLRSQFKERVRTVYRREGLAIEGL